ncbi:MAG TPA: phosphoribosylamine--glycine ligase [Caldilineaceae bacterium]|nr:phosphoribosylamine--glycine ligase [Caldilineaceae bacterium]
MKLLLIGSGGREHALAWKLSQSAQVEWIFVAPGNGGTATTDKCENTPIRDSDLPSLLAFAQAQAIDLTVVGPEVPLVAGVVDLFQAAGLPIFGPVQAAAQLEGSKAFSKAFMQRHAIPTGQAGVFTEFEAAADFAWSLDSLPVIKASGLAAGKGVVLPASREEAVTVLRQMLVERSFGEASATVLVEERLTGPEVSVLAFCDGTNLAVMPPAQDHKRLLTGDAGPNTGGMGAFAPSPLASPDFLAEVTRRVLRPTLDGMAAQGTPYVGVLYAGLMLTPSGIQVLEFNCRFGDPETQVVLPLLESDLLEILLACLDGRLGEVNPVWRGGAAATVVMASGGYPGAYATGKPIQGLAAAEAEGCTVFHAGTALAAGEQLTSGGRVLAVTGVDESLSAAAKRAYSGLSHIQFEGAIWRTDIARTHSG